MHTPVLKLFQNDLCKTIDCTSSQNTVQFWEAMEIAWRKTHFKFLEIKQVASRETPRTACSCHIHYLLFCLWIIELHRMLSTLKRTCTYINVQQVKKM